MSNLLLGAVGLAYVWVAIDYFMEGRDGMCIAFAAYAVANFGFVVENVLQKG